MEDILEVYHRPYDPKRPLVCIDEASKQQVKETREPLPRQAGKPERYRDYQDLSTNNLLIYKTILKG
jgi:hypothetical protein